MHQLLFLKLCLMVYLLIDFDEMHLFRLFVCLLVGWLPSSNLLNGKFYVFEWHKFTDT